MKILICGSRTISDYSLLIDAIKEFGYHPTSLISGGSHGVDKLAERFAGENNLKIDIYRPNYALYGAKKAPIVHDADMVIACDAVLAVWDGRDKETKFVTDCAVNKNKPLWVKEIR